MAFIAVATVGAAVIGAGAGLIGAGKASKAQREATNTNAALQREQNAQAQAQFEQGRADLAPYRDAGYTALGQLSRGTADGGEFNRNFSMADFQADPGFAFRQQEANQQMERGAAARGGVLSGGTLKAMTRYNQDAASQEYGNAYSRYNNDVTTRYNRLAGVAGTGQQATNSNIQAGQQNTMNQQGGVNNIMSNNNAGANARASQYAAGANAIGGAANSVGQFFQLRSLIGPGGLGGGSMTAPSVDVPGTGTLPGVTLPRFRG